MTANEYHSSDLFWALRGGGGDTYGVVVSVTYRTHEILPVTALSINVTVTTPEIAQNVTTEYFKLQPGLADAGRGGYTFINQPLISIISIAPNETVAQVNTTLGPFLDRIRAATGNPKDIEYLVGTFPSFYDWYISFFDTTGEVDSNSELYSRLLSRKIVEGHP